MGKKGSQYYTLLDAKRYIGLPFKEDLVQKLINDEALEYEIGSSEHKQAVFKVKEKSLGETKESVSLASSELACFPMSDHSLLAQFQGRTAEVDPITVSAKILESLAALVKTDPKYKIKAVITVPGL
jgi:hypothetical protein